MIKFISSKEHAKLTGDVDYWNCQALEQEHWHKEYKKLSRSLIRENELLKQKNKELEKGKVTFISLGEVKDLNKAKKLAEEIRKTINNEHFCNHNSFHNCNQSCFKEHVLPAIQSDYDKLSDFQKSDLMYQVKFFSYWENKLKKEYDFLVSIYKMKDTIFCQLK